ncbi:hypothetical protein E5288_WYG019703 [Bos mutus]|uniref:Uncharacterized protein n=1 Tax=Bos mutus TaxID=72004 RepID=A0A6B0S5D8_9CETA|nr:hypothetical protein [Bos mutus]
MKARMDSTLRDARLKHQVQRCLEKPEPHVLALQQEPCGPGEPSTSDGKATVPCDADLGQCTAKAVSCDVDFTVKTVSCGGDFTVKTVSCDIDSGLFRHPRLRSDTRTPGAPDSQKLAEQLPWSLHGLFPKVTSVRRRTRQINPPVWIASPFRI